MALLTVTAPGNARLPTERAMVDWNLAAPGKWRRLNQRAAEAVRRQGHRRDLVSRTYEYQRRGALHLHVVLGMRTAQERRAAHLYALELERLRHDHDFGYISDTTRSGKWRTKGLSIIPAGRAARYVAKYLSPLDANGKPTLSETVTRRDVPPHVVYVSRRLTTRTGVTMRSLRWRRRCWVARVDPDTGESYQSMAERGMCGDVDALERLMQLTGAPPDL